MSLTNLKTTVAAFLGQTVGALTSNGVDLFLVAANNARRKAEKLHNFEFSRIVATVTVDGNNGGLLSAATITGGLADTYVVTGSLSPNATGTYYRQGFFNGCPLYIDSTFSYFIYYVSGSWIIAATLNVGIPSNKWSTTTTALVPTGGYDAGGANTGVATVAVGTTSLWNGIKEVTALRRLRPNGSYIPLDFTRADIPIERERTELEFSDNLWPTFRYPSDADLRARGTASTVIQRGQTLYIYPGFIDTVDNQVALTIEGYGWLPEYTSLASASDFIITYGSNWLQWATICELNYIFKTFVPRTEGNLSPPEKAAEDAWNELLLWDSYQVDSNVTRSR